MTHHAPEVLDGIFQAQFMRLKSHVLLTSMRKFLQNLFHPAWVTDHPAVDPIGIVYAIHPPVTKQQSFLLSHSLSWFLSIYVQVALICPPVARGVTVET